MDYTKLGDKIKMERGKRGWDQAVLASQLGVKQQTVSRWEAGASRPKADALHKIAGLFAGDINEWLPLAGYQIAKPVRILAAHLPLELLSEEGFELFSADLVSELTGVKAHRYGTKGHEQFGIDLYADTTDGKLDYQCKRHKQFGPEDVKAAVKATTIEAKRHHLLLSRIASPEARKTMDGYKNWSLWDKDDISRMVRALPSDVAQRIVDTHFPGWRKAFLDIDEPSPWLSPDEFFRPLINRGRLFNHGWSFVGRQKQLDALTGFAKQHDSRALVVNGRGGIGKSRLLRAAGDEILKDGKVVFLSTTTELTPKDFERLPVGKAVLVVDDAHDRADLLGVLGGVARFRPDMLVIISTRPYGLTRIKDELTRSGFGYEPDSTITLSDLREEDAESLSSEIMKEVSGDTSHAKRIAHITKDCPLATVVGSRLVAEGRILPQVLNNSEDFQNELLRSFRNIVAGEIDGKNPEAVRDLLDFIAMVQPVEPNDPNFQEVAAKVLGRRFDKINRDMGALEDAGVLLRRGRKLRIAPDLLADYIRSDASYDDHNKRPTGYVDTVFSEVKDDLAKNLLINLSQLDWRLSAAGAQAELMAEVWANLEAQFKEAKIFGRQSLLKALAKISYYQPKQALAFARLAMDNPVEDIEEDAKKYMLGHGTSYRYVVDEIAPLLRYVAYHEDYLRDALDMLKELADKDPRNSSQHPDHPIRILRDLAGIEPGKSVYFNDLIVDHVLPWLDEPANDKFSPFDVLDEALATEGQQSETKGLTLSLTPYKINPEAVAEVRKKVIDAAFKQLLDADPRKAFRALTTIEHSLESPHGLGAMGVTKDDIAKWEPGIIEALNRLEKVITENQLDPFLMVQMRGTLSTRARYDIPKIKAAASKVLDAIPATREYDIARAMADAWGWTFDREGDTIRNDELCVKWRDKLAAEVLADYKGKQMELIEMLEDQAMRQVKAPLRSKEYGPFVAALMNQSPELTAALGEHLLKNPQSPLVGAFGIVITVLAQKQYAEAIALAKRATETKNVVLAQCTSRALGWSLHNIPVAPVEDDVIKALAAYDDEGVRHNITRVVKRYGEANKAAALEVLMGIRIDDSKAVADEVLSEIGKHGAFKVADLSANHIQHLHDQLLKAQTIEDYNIETYLSDLSAEHPEQAVKLLMERVEYKEAHDDADVWEDRYKPLPYVHHNGPALRVAETDKYEQLLKQVRDWTAVKTDNWVRAHYGKDLFKMVSAGFDKTTLKVLGEWIMSGDDEKLEAAASLLSEAPSNFAFTHTAYVVDLLEQAHKQGPAQYKRVTSWLYGAAISGSRTGTPGQPFPRDIEQRDRSYELMSQLPAGSPAHKFFKLLYDAAKENIERDTVDEEDLEFD